jgi:hypothetical protein
MAERSADPSSYPARLGRIFARSRTKDVICRVRTRVSGSRLASLPPLVATAVRRSTSYEFLASLSEPRIVVVDLGNTRTLRPLVAGAGSVARHAGAAYRTSTVRGVVAALVPLLGGLAATISARVSEVRTDEQHGSETDHPEPTAGSGRDDDSA